jgi:shikimate dehydrogenase
VSDAERTRLAVLGSPISHSKSPAIHRAAYAELGLEWEYGSADVTGAALPAYVEGLDASWRGLSLTMPLKRDVLALLDERDPLVDVVGGANTVRLSDRGRSGFNTDVYGAVQALREHGVNALDSVLVLGAGATAASVIAAVAELGARTATVLARTPARAQPLLAVGAAVGVAVTVRPYDQGELGAYAPDAVVSTVPGGADLLEFPAEVRRHAVLFEIAYDPWPTSQVRQWLAAGGTVVSGFDLLIHQAVGQIRVFLSGDPTRPLPAEVAVVAAMRAAV